jgi:hypothetical protein
MDPGHGDSAAVLEGAWGGQAWGPVLPAQPDLRSCRPRASQPHLLGVQVRVTPSESDIADLEETRTTVVLV